MSVAIQLTQNFLGAEPECSQVCKFVKEFRPDLLGVRTAGIEVLCKLVQVAAHLAALSKRILKMKKDNIQSVLCHAETPE